MVDERDIRAYAAKIAERFDPERIILFGSYAYGTPTEDSDVDLLVVMRHEGDPVGKATVIRSSFAHPRFPLDLLVRDPEVLAWRIAYNDWFLRECVEKGRVLYGS